LRPRPLTARPFLLALVLAALGDVSSPQQLTHSQQETVLKIQQFIKNHQFTEARAIIREAQKQFGDGSLDNLRGVVDIQEGDWRAAERDFRRAIRRSPKSTAAYLNLGRLYQEHSAHDSASMQKALDVYRAVLSYEHGNEEANYQAAVLLMGLHEYKESLTNLTRLSETTQDSTQVLAIRCADQAGIGDRRAADETAARLTTLIDFSEDDLRAALPVLISSSRDDLIIKFFESIASRVPLSSTGLRALGLAYERSNRLTDAKTTLEKSTTDQRFTVAVLLDLTRVARKQKDYAGALGYLAHARDLDPGDATLHYYFGLVCLEMNLLAEAQKAFGVALQLQPNNPDYNYAMGTVTAFSQDPAQATTYFKKYMSLKPNDPKGKLAVGAAFFRAKNYDAAEPALRESVAFSETAPTAHYYLGRIARVRDEPDKAIEELKVALSSDPKNPDVLAELGQCHLMKRDYNAAEEDLQRALAINPDHYAANFNLMTLYTRTGDPRKEALAKHFEELKSRVWSENQEFMRMLEVRPIEGLSGLGR
jgi:tetratricopeptide (TPR) repeat protein